MSNVQTVVLKDVDGGLRARVIASRAGLVSLEAVEPGSFPEGRAVKLVVGELAADDFVVRVVCAGSRRKVELVAGTLPVGLDSELESLPQIGEAGCQHETTGNGAVIELGQRSVVNVAA